MKFNMIIILILLRETIFNYSRNLILTSCLSILFILMISCNEDGRIGKSDFHFEVVDSLYVQNVFDLEYLDKDMGNESFLFYSLKNKMIYLIDRNTKKTIEIPFPGQATSASGYGLKSGCFVTFNSEESIVLWTNKGYHFYDLTGSLYRNVDYKTNYSHPISAWFNTVEQGDQLLAYQTRAIDLNDDGSFSFEDSRLVERFSFDSKISNLYKGFLDEDPRLLIGEFKRKVVFEGDDYLHILFSPDNTISTYSLKDSFDFVRQEKIEIPNYEPPSIPRFSYEELLINPDIYWFFGDAKHFYLIYKLGIDPKEVNFNNSGILDDASLNQVVIYMYIHDRTTGHGYSVELPKLLPGFKAKLEDNLFLGQPSSILREHEMGNVFYIVALEN